MLRDDAAVVAFVFAAGWNPVPLAPMVMSSWYRRRASAVPLMPPAWLFPIAWTVLYVLLGLSVGLFWRNAQCAAGADPEMDECTDSPAFLVLALVYWVLNKAWQPIFQSPQRSWRQSVALVVLIAGLGVLIAVVAVAASAPNGAASAWLLVPLLAWTVFAGYLNAAFI